MVLEGFWGPAESGFTTPELLKQYPYTLVTGARIPYFFHSENRVPGPLRDKRPDPLVEIHPALAREKGIKEGDWARIESRRGSCIQRAKLSVKAAPDILAADHGWWFPEEDDLGWDKSNIDILTDNAFDTCDPAFGATNLRTLLVNIEKAGDAGMAGETDG